MENDPAAGKEPYSVTVRADNFCLAKKQLGKSAYENEISA
jgi:hypothetical protein